MKRIGSLLALALISGCAAGKPKHPTCDKSEPVCAVSRCDANGCRIFAVNKSLHPVTMKIRMKADNLSRAQSDSGPFVVKPGESVLREKLRVWNPNRSFQLDYRYTWMRGAFDARPDTQYAYRLPFETGKTMSIVQGYNGTVSHSGPQRFSIDFGLALGTAIHAAREGVVIELVEKHDTACFQVECNKFVNYIDVLHPDGTIADYAHLSKDGALVSVGDTVSRGQKIGISGNTGYSKGPHLHFMVIKAADDTSFTTLPTLFQVRGGLAASLKEGMRYQAD